MVNERDTVVLLEDIPERGLAKGDAGAVVAVLGQGQAFMVEFVTMGGETHALVSLPGAAIRAIAARDLMHVREVA